MANEIRATIQVKQYDGSTLRDSPPTSQGSYTQTTKFKVSLDVDVGTTEESITFTSLGITTNGFMLVRNYDTTNYVQLGVTAGSYFGRIKAGEVQWFRLEPGKTLYLKANTAACKINITMYDD